MHSRMAWLLGAFVLGSAGWAVVSMLQGAEQVPAAPNPCIAQPAALEPAVCSDVTGDLEEQLRSSLHQAAAWLARSSPASELISGRLSLASGSLEEGKRRQQADVLFGLACAARFMSDRPQSAAVQSRVEILLRQATPALRNCCQPATAGVLVRTIHELPTPTKPLLAQCEELCRRIAEQQRSDGAFADSNEVEAGELLMALMAGRQRPPAWKIATAERACSYYLPHWRAHRNLASLPAQVQAYALAYRWTGQTCFAQAVREMTDWLCRLQYTTLDPQHPHWLGGFREWVDGRPVATEPTIRSAEYAEALALACRMVSQAGDGARYRKYRIALERCVRFVMTLQYTPAASRDFAAWYRPVVQGGFYVSQHDGTPRLDATRHAVGALMRCLEEVSPASLAREMPHGRLDLVRVYYLLSAAFYESSRRPAGMLPAVDVS